MSNHFKPIISRRQTFGGKGLPRGVGEARAAASLPLPFSLGDALAEEANALAKGSSFPLVSLIGDGRCSHGSRLSTLRLRLQRTRAAFLLVLHAFFVFCCAPRPAPFPKPNFWRESLRARTSKKTKQPSLCLN
jgi:hypothetical protein